MGRDQEDQGIEAKNIERYLLDRGVQAPRVTGMRRLGESNSGDTLKSYGYGKPLLVEFVDTATPEAPRQNLVIRTMTPDPFGHSRRCDRIANMVQSFDTFRRIPRHIHATDVGTFDEQGTFVSIGTGEPYLITNFVEGELYACDLESVRKSNSVGDLHRRRATALADYASALHAEQASASTYSRFIRDVVGGGEGIFGLCDSYPSDHPSVTSGRLEKVEHAAVQWRWRLARGYAHRARRTHGDFHPYNILFSEGTELSVLDCSRGAVGDPADDVCCLTINYLFAALLDGDYTLQGPMRTLWDQFWSRYLETTGDEEILEVVAPFFAWRALVLASPVWYAGIDPRISSTLMRFVERLLAGAAFDPKHIQEHL